MIKLLQKRPKTIFLLILGGIFLTNTTFAQSVISSDFLNSATSSDDLLQSMATLMSTVINVLTFISLWILGIIGELVGTEYITGEDAMNVLLPMWRYVRDLVNIGFVLVLVGLAFTNLYSSFGEGGNWTIKEKLPKIIIAIVLVNFSSLFFRILIDAVNVGSVALFSIADSQLEANRATSVEDIIGNRSWKIISKPEYLNNSISVSAKFDKNGSVIEMSPESVKKYVLLPPIVPASIDSSCDSSYDDKYRGTSSEIHYVGQVLYTETFQGNDDKFKGKIAVCNSFSESINDLFCAKGNTEDEGCMFKLNNSLNEKTSQKYKNNSTAQNLFLAFGIQFIHLERLPTMAANVNSLQGVLSGALFGIIMSVAYIIALIAFFIALVTRMFVLWIAIIGSPVIVSASIMGFDEVKDGYEKFITNLIIPLKMALAFGVSFVMISGMSTMRPGTALNSGIIDFGPQLANLSLDAYGLFWQAVTIYAFWSAARWAVKGSEAEKITDYLFNGAEKVGEMLAKSATIENQFMSIPGDKSGAKVGLSTLASAPLQVLDRKRQRRLDNSRKFYDKLAGTNYAALENDLDTFSKSVKNASTSAYAKKLTTHIGTIDAEHFSNEASRKKVLEGLFRGKKKEEALPIIEAIENKALMKDLKAMYLDPGSNAKGESFAKNYAKGGTSSGDNSTPKEQTTSKTEDGINKYSFQGGNTYNIKPTDSIETRKKEFSNVVSAMKDSENYKQGFTKYLLEDFVNDHRSLNPNDKDKTDREIIDAVFSSDPKVKAALYRTIKEQNNAKKTNDPTNDAKIDEANKKLDEEIEALDPTT